MIWTYKHVCQNSDVDIPNVSTALFHDNNIYCYIVNDKVPYFYTGWFAVTEDTWEQR